MAARRNFDPDAERPHNDESSLTRVARLSWDVGAINEQLDSINKKLDNIDSRFGILSGEFVTQREFATVHNIVYGMVGLILVGFMGAVVTFFLRQGG